MSTIAPDQIRFDEPHAGLQRLAARFGGHAYDLHRHETYAVGLTLRGVQAFHYRGARTASRAGQVIVLHPDEAHDGHAGVADGFAYRMLYVDTGWLAKVQGQREFRPLAAVISRDAGLHADLMVLFDLLHQVHAPEALEAEAWKLASRIAAGPTFAHGMTKTQLNQEWNMGLEQAIEAEAQAQAICMQTRDFERAYRAFVAKEKPVFAGD